MFTTLYFVILTAHVCVVHVHGKPEPSKRAAVRGYSSETQSKSELSSGGHNDASLEKQILAEIGIQSMPPALSKVTYFLHPRREREYISEVTFYGGKLDQIN